MKIVVFASHIPAATRLCYPNADKADMVLHQQYDQSLQVMKTKDGEFRSRTLDEVLKLERKGCHIEMVGDVLSLEKQTNQN